MEKFMKKIISIAIALVLTLGILSLFGVLASANEPPQTFVGLELPEVSLEPKSYGSTVSMGIDREYIWSAVPPTLVNTYEDGVMTIESDVLDNVKFYSSGVWYHFDREGDKFVCEIPAEAYNANYTLAELELGQYIISYNNYKIGVIMIYGDKFDNISVNELYIYSESVMHVLEYAENEISTQAIVNYDSDGNYASSEIRGYYDNFNVSVYYDSARAFQGADVYIDSKSHYYLGEKYGWREYNHYTSDQIAAPAGFEDKNIEYFTTLLPCVVPCDHLAWIDVSCAAPRHCADCPLTEGEALPHSWVGNGTCADPTRCTGCGELDGEATHSWVDVTCLKPKHCSICKIMEGGVLEHNFVDTSDGRSCVACGTVYGNLSLPEYTEDLTIARQTLEELGVDHYIAHNAFPENIEISYENGIYYITDIGVEKVEFYSFLTYENLYGTLVDGKWQIEMPEDVYNRNGIIRVYSGNWETVYRDGIKESVNYCAANEHGTYFYIEVITEFVKISTTRYIGEDYYSVVTYYTSAGQIDSQNVTSFWNNIQIATEYNAERYPIEVSTYLDGWYYMSPDGSWSGSYGEVACEAPEPFAGMSFEELAALNPCFIDCGNHTPSEVSCGDDQFCTVCYEILGKSPEHDWQSATCTENETCSVCGETRVEGYGHSWLDATCIDPKTCDNCGATEGDALGHNYEATVTAPDCDHGGYTRYVCSECGDNYTGDETSALGHDWSDPVCGQYIICNVCGEGSDDIVAHSWIDATYDAPKTCSACGDTEGEPLERPEEPTETEPKVNETEEESAPAQGETEPKTDEVESETQNEASTGIILDIESESWGNEEPIDKGDISVTPSEDEGKKKGCGATVGTSALVILTTIGIAGVAFVGKKKKN